MQLCILGIEQSVSSSSFFVLISKEGERYTTNINQLVTNFVPPPFLYSVLINSRLLPCSGIFSLPKRQLQEDHCPWIPTSNRHLATIWHLDPYLALPCQDHRILSMKAPFSR